MPRATSATSSSVKAPRTQTAPSRRKASTSSRVDHRGDRRALESRACRSRRSRRPRPLPDPRAGGLGCAGTRGGVPRRASQRRAPSASTRSCATDAVDRMADEAGDIAAQGYPNDAAHNCYFDDEIDESLPEDHPRRIHGPLRAEGGRDGPPAGGLRAAADLCVGRGARVRRRRPGEGRAALAAPTRSTA